MPVARRVLGKNHQLTLRTRFNYAAALHNNEGATLDDVREAVTTLEEIEPIARRVLGGAHPLTLDIDAALRAAREIHAIREELEANQAALDEAREELEANQAALDEAAIEKSRLRASITRLYQLACALVALLVALVAAIVFKR